MSISAASKFNALTTAQREGAVAALAELRRPLTAAQREGAVAALAELRRLYLARLDYMMVVIGIFEIFDAHALPMPIALNDPGALESVVALFAAINQITELIEPTGVGCR